MSKYITRQGGATVTVFVPYDCENKCPFCINKEEYSRPENFSLEKIIRSIEIMSAMTPFCDFVFTGGEPLADCEALQKMLEAANPQYLFRENTHKVFINTTLPTNKYSKEQLAEYLNKWYKEGLITGINVSRHLNKYVQECDDSIFEMLDFEPRINCVLYTLNTQQKDIKEKLVAFVERFMNITGYIQFRKDYVVTTTENLYDLENDEIFKVLKETFEYKHPFGEYRMRVGYEFAYKDYKITYHKTLPYSKLPALYMEGTDKEIPMADPETDIGTFVLYDIIIKQDGSIKEDWDICSTITFADRKSDVLAKDLDLNEYRNVVFEEYK